MRSRYIIVCRRWFPNSFESSVRFASCRLSFVRYGLSWVWAGLGWVGLSACVSFFTGTSNIALFCEIRMFCFDFIVFFACIFTICLIVLLFSGTFINHCFFSGFLVVYYFFVFISMSMLSLLSVVFHFYFHVCY